MRILTPVTAVVALYLAWQQCKINEQQFEFDLYERRLRVYEQVLAILQLVIRDFKPEFSDLQTSEPRPLKPIFSLSLRFPHTSTKL